MFAKQWQSIRSVHALMLISMCAFVLSTTASSIATAQTTNTLTASLVRTTHTSRWNPASPDPSGITYWPARGTLIVVDGEVEEMPKLYKGVNVFEATTKGSLVRTHDTTRFTEEPVGIDISVEPGSNRFFIADDSKKRIFIVSLGADGKLGTADDTITSFSTAAFGNNDPEGLTFGTINGQRRLFMVDGVGRRVYVQAPGPNGRFDGVGPEGDDRVTSFDLAVFNVGDPEGIEFNPATGRLYVVDRKVPRIFDLTTSGGLVGTVDLRQFNMVNPSDLALAPGSKNTAVRNLYITDRGVDNNVDPNENDGKIYEIKLN